MPVQDTYTDRQAALVKGQKVDGEEYNAITRVCETVAGIAFGTAVLRGANDQGCIAGDATLADATFLGVALRDVTIRPSAPGNGDLYPQYGNVTVLTGGAVAVQVGEAVNDGEAAFYNPTDGKFYNDAQAGAAFALPAGWRFDSTAALDGLAVLVKR